MDQLLTSRQASEFLQIPVKAVHELCRKGLLSYVKINDRNERRFKPEHLEEYVANRTVLARKTGVDKKQAKQLPYPRKGGEKKVGLSRTDLKKEMRSW